MNGRDKRIPSRMDSPLRQSQDRKKKVEETLALLLLTRTVSWEQPVATCRSGTGPTGSYIRVTFLKSKKWIISRTKWMSRVSAKSFLMGGH